MSLRGANQIGKTGAASSISVEEKKKRHSGTRVNRRTIMEGKLHNSDRCNFREAGVLGRKQVSTRSAGRRIGCQTGNTASTVTKTAAKKNKQESRSPAPKTTPLGRVRSRCPEPEPFRAAPNAALCFRWLIPRASVHSAASSCTRASSACTSIRRSATNAGRPFRSVFLGKTSETSALCTRSRRQWSAKLRTARAWLQSSEPR